MEMKVIGLLFGMEQSFPPALVERINSVAPENIRAEFVKIGAIKMADLMKYDVILDRISQDIPFYRSMLKNAALGGTRIVNNPFWWSADDKFFNYALASQIGVPVPKTVLLPSKDHPPTTTSESMRNLTFPLNWEEVFEYVGFPSYLKPHDGGGWKHVYKVHNPQEFFEAYHKTGDICMTLQAGVDFQEYYRCYAIGKKYIHIMPYEPRNPHHLRYVAEFSLTPARKKQIEELCLKIVNALGYDFNTIEFAVQDDIPYAIDFLNPAPDAEATSVQPENFEWVLEHAAKYLIEVAQEGRKIPTEYTWSEFLGGGGGSSAKTSAKSATKKTADSKSGAAKSGKKAATKK
jgi:glutathione synthase/RimK-type ligase-like ATP-grasp enzyme